MRKTAAVIGIGFLSTVWLTGCVSDEMIIQANQKERPDYEECVYSYRERETDSSELLLAYDKEKEQLYVLESVR